MKARLRFHGAAQEVTGSMHLLEANGSVIALDCGLFQGRRKLTREKNRTLPVPASTIDTVVLSHAHVDHCGRLPLLVREGFKGRILATSATCDLAEILLADSAHIHEEDAAYWNKKRVKRGDEPIEPLYTTEDVAQTVPLLESRELAQPFEVAPGVRATLHEAGHMLGSCMICLQIDDGNGRTMRVTYTGDIGRKGMQILRDPAPIPPCDYLICESTYGGRETSKPEPMREELAGIVNGTVDRGGKIIIPSFAVGRAQVLVYELHMGQHDGLIKEKFPIIVDSPLAVAATEVFRKHPEIFNREATRFHKLTGGMLTPDNVEYTQSVEESKTLNHRPPPMAIISASGMCEVGRILHHLKNNVENPKNTVLIVGYQAEHTLGRRILEGAKQVKIFGEMYDMHAEVRVMNGFSAHANAGELIDRIMPLKKDVRHVFLVHGELAQAKALAGKLRDTGFDNVDIPEDGQAFELT